jgi:tRNA dimethylallyltransferase
MTETNVCSHIASGNGNGSLPRLVVVLGTNASGKSALGVELARSFGGEVVSADSRQVYRRLDLASAKLTPAEMKGVPHHLLDVVDLGDPFSLADFQRLAYERIDAIHAAGRLPILVGGTGLYVRAVVEGYELVAAAPDRDRRAELDGWSDEQLLAELDRLDPTAAAQLDLPNRRRLVRAVEIASAGYARAEARRRRRRYDALVLGLTWPRDALDERIAIRLRERFDAGLIAEIQGLLDDGVDPAVLDGLGLEPRFVLRYLRGEHASEDELFDELRHASLRFARRQMSWFRRDGDVVWLATEGDYVAEARDLVARFTGRAAAGASPG